MCKEITRKTILNLPMDSAKQSDECPPKQVFVLLIQKIHVLLVVYFDLNMLVHTEIHNLLYGV